jgi:hypothetical protein
MNSSSLASSMACSSLACRMRRASVRPYPAGGSVSAPLLTTACSMSCLVATRYPFFAREQMGRVLPPHLVALTVRCALPPNDRAVTEGTIFDIHHDFREPGIVLFIFEADIAGIGIGIIPRLRPCQMGPLPWRVAVGWVIARQRLPQSSPRALGTARAAGVCRLRPWLTLSHAAWRRPVRAL